MRTVAAAVFVLGGALAGGSLLLVNQLQAAQAGAVDRAIQLEVAAVASLAQRTLPPNPLPTTTETNFVQVVDEKGHVIAGSAAIEGQGQLISQPVTTSTLRYTTVPDLPIGEGGSYRVAARRIATPNGPLTVYAGESLAAVERSERAVVTGLIIADPILLGLVAVMAWLAVRRALGPVERIRTEVATISAGALDRRVAVPATRDEIERLAVTMNELLSRLESSAIRQRTFVADASHELRSPVAAAQAELEVALAHAGAAEWRGVARNALGDLERVRRIVDDLLILVRYEQVAPARVVSHVDLDEIVLDECTRIKRTASVTVDCSEVSAARVTGDDEGLTRVVRNLIDNAARHARSKVCVGLRQKGAEAELWVSDDGPGVLPADRERIFERFTRGDNARSRWDGGSGLGLAIVKEVVQRYGGTVEVFDANPGARFVVRIPAPM
jgi:signal transduction histidine kinase